MKRRWQLGVSFFWWLLAASVSSSWAQAVPAQPPSGGTSTTTTTMVPYFPGAGVAGIPPGAGAPNTYGGTPAPQNDGFTFKYGSNTRTLHGKEGGPIFTGPPGGSRAEVPVEHVVKHGDTLSTLADQYFHDGSVWPQLWALNPHIQNPNWLYPGDRLKLREGTPAKARTGLFDRKRTVAPNTVFLRTEGFIEDKSDEDWGELVGSPRDNMFLSDLNETYVHIPGDHDVRPGQELTIFRHVRDVKKGKIVRILGAVRVNAWDEKNRTARATIIESLDVIERGSRVGPLDRRIDIVASTTADRDVNAKVLATVYPLNFYAQNQVVFIDKGDVDGVKVGNRLRIFRQGDAWRKSLVTPGAGNRIRHETTGLPELERPSDGRASSTYPTERVGELRVIRVKEHTSTCLVTDATLELDTNDVAWLRQGY